MEKEINLSGLIREFTLGGRTFELRGCSVERPLVAAYVDRDDTNIVLIDIDDGDNTYWNESTLLQSMNGANDPSWWHTNRSNRSLYKVDKTGYTYYLNCKDDIEKIAKDLKLKQ